MPEPTDHVDETIESIIELHRRADRRTSAAQRTVEAWTYRLGSARLALAALAVTLVWVALNGSIAALGRHAPDPPPFYWLETFASVGALLMTLLIVATENRQGSIAERRAQLDLQINLLTERKVTKLIGMLEDLRRDSPTVRDRHDPEVARMLEATDPQQIADRLDERHGQLLEGELTEAAAPADAGQLRKD